MRATEVGPTGGGTSAEILTSLYAELRRIAAARCLGRAAARRFSRLRWFTRLGCA
jgi:hypothetical protein